MSGRWRHRVRRVRRLLAYGVAVVLILVASLVGLVSQVLPILERYPDQVAAWISARAGQPVSFDRLNARWTRSGPLLSLHGLRVGEPGGRIEVGRADLVVAVYSGLFPGRPLTEIRLADLALELTREADGRWSLQGLASGDRQTDPLATLRGLGELQVRNAALTVRVPDRDLTATIDRLDARIRVSGERLRVGLRIHAEQGPPQAVVVDLERGRGGRAWFGGESVALAALNPLLAEVGIETMAGAGELQAWFAWDSAGAFEARLEADLEGLVLRGLAPIALDARQPDGPRVEPRLAIERWRARVRWQRQAEGDWRLQAPLLRWHDGNDEHRLDGLHAATGVDAGLIADRADLSPWLALAALTDRVPAATRRWLYLAAPKLNLRAVEVAGDWLAATAEGSEDGAREDAVDAVSDRPAGQTVRRPIGRARIAAATWLPVGRTPGIEALQGELQFDDRALALDFDDQASPRLDWPVAFGAPVHLALSGGLSAWRAEPGVVIETRDLRLASEGFGLRALLRIDASQPERPALFGNAEIEPGRATALKRFWLRHQMSETLIDWLDRAIVDGQLAGGRAVIGGALADWPFRSQQGQFLAEVDLAGVPLQFSPEWPAADRLDARLRFTGSSLDIEGSGGIGGGGVERVHGRIEDFRASVLELALDANAEGGQVLALLRSSPLRENHGEHLDALRLGGRVRVQLGLRQPLKSGLGEFELRGTADLAGAQLAHAGWQVAFDRAEGRLRFGRDGLAAEELQVWLGEDVASFSLATGDGFVSDPGLIAEASLRGRFPAARLLAHAPDLDWLGPYLDGRADWTVAIESPRPAAGQADPPARLRLQSDLVGLALGLPAPLRKGVDQALPLRLQMTIPVQAESLSLELGALMRLDGRIGEDGRLDGLVAFMGDAGAMPDGRGLRIVGQVPVLDAAGWAGLAGGGAGQGVLHSVEILAGELDLLDRAFLDTRVVLSVEPEQMRLHLEGPEIAGRMVFPRDETSALTGDFERLYWPAGRIASAATGNPDPAALPPLRLRVEDLRFGAARLGRALLDTYPTPEGLHVERLESDSEMLKLVASGDWTTIDGSPRSRFALAFTSSDLGRMLDALGFPGLVAGGEVEATMVAAWSGSPAAFGMEKIDGSLELKVGSGRFLDVEPGGAGRLLGLVSLAELPRRLILDFRDLFGEGLQFGAITGRFQLAAGVATTDDLDIDSSSARIRVRGRTLLTDERYDQTIEVLPKTSSMLPALGALAGGPAGVALGALAQAIFRSPMQQMGRTVFQVTGPWSEPVVEVIERGAARDPEAGPTNDPDSEPPSRP